MENFLLRLFRMSDEVWARHANPWSVWTRLPIIALIAAAIWSRVWLGWWCLVPLALVLIWTWFNPRVFAKPASTDNWTSKGVLGERIWLDRGGLSIAPGLKRIAHGGNVIALLGMVLLAYGLVDLVAWAAIVGAGLAIAGKMVFLDAMVRVFDGHKDARAEWAALLY